jgi:DNA-binding transcriptional ArsR family regulator
LLIYGFTDTIVGVATAFEILGDPVRRRILELLADGELTSGAVSTAIQDEFGISQPGVSAHLRVLREGGLATVRVQGARRLYRVGAGPLRDIDGWLDRFRRFWGPHLDALETELARNPRKLAIDLEDEGERSG